MKIYTEILFLVLVDLLLFDFAGGIRGLPPLQRNHIYVTMWDGNTYHGIIRPRPNIFPPCFLNPNSEFELYVYYIRTEHHNQYASLLSHMPPVRPIIHDLHFPMQFLIKIGNSQIYSGNNFEVYNVNEHNHACTSTINYVEGNLPESNHVYIGVPPKGVYRSVLHEL
ncbi:uncharacterized protein LOC117170127 [Belonocnema kinseyi]|uniref:uncharacterized protein LOC117170127 n=1 Tax=Belonocnema kinseyi TaxID=2817044 RepID=UPI00143DC824|nr:uncharacterized protein LOC117170127 [Belonocnema kinseyi]